MDRAQSNVNCRLLARWTTTHPVDEHLFEENIFFNDKCRNSRALIGEFCGQYMERHMNLKFMRRVSEQACAIQQFIILKKQIDVSF